MDWDIIGILAVVAFLAGFFDAIAGGGGLITLPALFLAGVEPISAIATNKFQAASASVSATVAFARKGMIEWRQGRFLVLFGLLGGAGGALLVTTINQQWLVVCVPILLIFVAGYFLFSPTLVTRQERRQRVSVSVFSFTITPILGFYDGVFGPGVGSFFMVGFVLLCGLGMMQAISFTKLANASCNLGSLAVFMTKGMIIWPLAIAMALASFAGAQLGARVAVSVGPRLIRPMLIVVCCALAIKLLSAENNPLRMVIFSIIER